MNTRQTLPLMLAAAVAGLLAGALASGLRPAAAQQKLPPANAATPRWEYCAIADISFSAPEGGPRSYGVQINYSGGGGGGGRKESLRVEEAAGDPVLVVAAKLGGDGWEMIGHNAVSLGTYNRSGVFFKRAVK